METLEPLATFGSFHDANDFSLHSHIAGCFVMHSVGAADMNGHTMSIVDHQKLGLFFLPSLQYNMISLVHDEIVYP